jgi:hypothetical protein
VLQQQAGSTVSLLLVKPAAPRIYVTSVKNRICCIYLKAKAKAKALNHMPTEP